jgi:hypothetical protein
MPTVMVKIAMTINDAGVTMTIHDDNTSASHSHRSVNYQRLMMTTSATVTMLTLSRLLDHRVEVLTARGDAYGTASDQSRTEAAQWVARVVRIP